MIVGKPPMVFFQHLENFFWSLPFEINTFYESELLNKTPAKHRDIFRDTLIAKKSMAKERFEPTTYWLGNKKIQAPARV